MQETTPEQLVSLAKTLPKKGFNCIIRNVGLYGFTDHIYKKTHYEGVLFSEDDESFGKLSLKNRYMLNGLSHKPIFHVERDKYRFMVEDDSSVKRYVGKGIELDGLHSQSIFTPMLFATMKKNDTAMARNIVRMQLEILLDDTQPCEAVGIYSNDFILYSNPITVAKLSDADDRISEPEFDHDENWDMLFSKLKSLR